MLNLTKILRGAKSSPLEDDKENRNLLEEYCCGRIVSQDPFITFSNQRLDRDFFPVFEIAKSLPERFQGTKGLHFVATNWLTNEAYALRTRDQIEAAALAYPGHEFILMVANEVESYTASKVGIPTVVANKSIFEDESIWQIAENAKAGKSFDAVYLARLDRFKRHQLASQIKSLNLVYAPTMNEEPEEALNRYRSMLPNARFANHDNRNGKYVYMRSQKVCDEINLAKVGLCLSPAEGIMRASIQYMLCGLPIVSTPSIGGRDRYYNNEYCSIVEAEPEAVSAAVHETISKEHDPEKIRAYILEQLAFDRYNFLLSAKKIAANHFNCPEPSMTFDALKGTYLNWQKLGEIIERWKVGT